MRLDDNCIEDIVYRQENVTSFLCTPRYMQQTMQPRELLLSKLYQENVVAVVVDQRHTASLSGKVAVLILVVLIHLLIGILHLGKQMVHVISFAN